jgi:hypothetical protein
MKPLLLVLALAAPQFALDLRFGLKAGVPATSCFETGRASGRTSAEYSAATRRYTLGASAEWRATPALGLTIDALHHRMGYVAIVSFFGGGVLTTSAVDVKGNSFDFPLRVRYYFGGPSRLFASGGFVMRHVGPVRGRGESVAENLITGTVTRTPIDTADPSELRKRFYPGLTAGGGMEVGRGRLRFVPEFRYTRWTANIAGPGGLLRFAPNQAEILLGLEF